MTDGNDRGDNAGVNDAILLGACCTALATLVPVAMYQTGLLRRLPDPPSRIFDSERIASSKAAHPFGVPDALLGMANFGATLALIVLSRSSPVAKKLLGVKLMLDAAAGTFNAGRQVVSFGRLCSCCTGTAISAGVMAYAGRDIIQETLRSLDLFPLRCSADKCGEMIIHLAQAICFGPKARAIPAWGNAPGDDDSEKQRAGSPIYSFANDRPGFQPCEFLANPRPRPSV